ncbi:MAG TPA: hypothetical protein VG986_05140 [Pseudolabrys sp.]|nr:hypothetical protein [Pseudolabrys sp.]
MIIGSVLAVSLVLNVSLGLQAPAPAAHAGWMQQLSLPQRNAALLPAVRRATECIVQRAASDARYRADMSPAEMNDLIVDSITACGRLVRAMMDVHDRMYGAGSGEAFLLGPYLDVLPAAVVRQARARMPAR